MSDAPTPPTPPVPPSPGDKPSVKTSSVPLKKETVRITLRAKPEGTEGAPPPPPTAPLRPSAPPPPAARPAPPPAPLGSKTIPLTQAPAPRPGAPTAPVRPAGPAPAGGTSPTQPMPKATVKLQQPTIPISGAPTSSITSAPVRTGASTVIEDDEDAANSGMDGIAIAAVLIGIALLVLTLLGSDKAEMFTGTSATEAQGFFKNPKKGTASENIVKRVSDANSDVITHETSLVLPEIPAKNWKY